MRNDAAFEIRKSTLKYLPVGYMKTVIYGSIFKHILDRFTKLIEQQKIDFKILCVYLFEKFATFDVRRIFQGNHCISRIFDDVAKYSTEKYAKYGFKKCHYFAIFMCLRHKPFVYTVPSMNQPKLPEFYHNWFQEKLE